MICRYCHHEFDVDSSFVGQDLRCPNCNGTVNVSEKTIVRRCPACKTQLSVEVWMLGTTVPCPVCQHGVKLSLDAATTRTVFDTPAPDKDTEISLSPGDIFGKYKIESCLGVGGMGEVYLATHSFLGTPCAIKLMRKNATVKEEDKQRLLREARLTSSIHHQNLIAVLDADIDPATGMLYIVMEYVDGISIDQILENGPMPEDRVLPIIREVAEALQAAEEMQIVHRDIKPANIMLTSRGKVKLADLGIAKTDSETSVTLTMDSAILGTPHYASPEQLRASHQVDSRADIYSLGATMYHMLSGNYPFPGDSVFSIMAMVLEKEPVPLQNIAKISPMTASLVHDMMAKEADDRPANMTELISRIDQVLQFLQNKKQVSPATLQTVSPATVPSGLQPSDKIKIKLKPDSGSNNMPRPPSLKTEKNDIADKPQMSKEMLSAPVVPPPTTAPVPSPRPEAPLRPAAIQAIRKNAWKYYILAGIGFLLVLGMAIRVFRTPALPVSDNPPPEKTVSN